MPSLNSLIRYNDIRVIKDLAGLDRVVVARYYGTSVRSGRYNI